MKLIRIILASCIIISLAFFIYHTDLVKVISSIYQIGYKFIILLLITAVAYLFATLSWKYSMGNKFNNISIIELFMIRHVGETVSLLNPVSIISGETLKVYLLRNHRIEKKTVIGSVLISRAIMIITQVLLFLIALIVLTLQMNWWSTINYLVVPSPYIILAIGTGLAVLFNSRHRIKLHILKTTRGRFLIIKLKQLTLKIGEITIELKAVLKSNKLMVGLSCILAALHWITGAMEFYLILKFLGIKVTLMKALIVDMGVIIFKTAGAFIPGQLGIEEYGNKIMLGAIGVPGSEIWITASILRRTRQFCWIILGGLIYLYLFKKKELII